MLLQSSEHEKMDFVGREGTGDDTDSQLKHYVAIVDPENKTWQIVEARRVTLRGGVRTITNDEDEDSEEENVCFMRLLGSALRYLILTDAEHYARSTHGLDQHIRYKAVSQGCAVHG